VPPPRWRIPPFRTAAELLRSQAHLLRPREKLSVSAWAIKHQGFDPEVLPWAPEVMDSLSDPSTAETGLMGPSQGGKTTIGLAWTGWIIDTDPDETLIAQPSQNLAQVFVETRVNPMIDNTEAVKAKLSPDLNANNLWLKKFRGMHLFSVWPVAAQFAQRPVRYAWLDDYDQFPDDIEGQGSAITLAGGRDASFEGREKKFVSSSPADDQGGKTEAFVAGGTDERLRPECPSCGDRWEIDLLRDLRFDVKAGPDEAETTAHVVCGANGCILEPKDRRALLRSLETLPAHGFVAANDKVSKRRRTFRIDGLMALTSWPKLARLWREAQIEWEVRQDETLLRTFVNTKAGKNYRSQLSGEKPLDAETLKLRREKGWMAGAIPAGVKVWGIQIDVQHNRVECQAFGWGDGLEGWLIKRWPIDVLDDGLTTLAPFSHPEHSAVLLPLFNLRMPLADGSGLSPPPLTVQLDVGGGGAKGEGATEFAKAFWNAARALGIHRSRITLTKGGNRPTADLMPRAKFADQKRRGGAKKTSAELWIPNVHRLKHIVDARLRRTDPGPGYIHLPGGKTGGGALRRGQDENATGRLLDEHVEEITAEELQKGRWVKVRPRNETWDLLVAAYASILRPPFAQSRTHMRWVPAAFRVPEQEGGQSDTLDERDKAGTKAAAQAKAATAPALPPAAPEATPTPPLKAQRLNRKSWVKPPRGGRWLDRRR
jgi:phage terminase large subunit GpA-like protein